MATVVVIAIGAMLSAVAAGGVLLGGAVTARHRAGAAADMAAIAAAQHALEGPAAACRAAAAIARVNRASVDTCRVVGAGVVEVRVRLAVSGPFGRLGPARAVARAGPVDR
jgi:secretion/DNA translocation related TadE-like protein